MKKIYLLFVAAALAACSAEPVENEGIESLNAAAAGKNKITAQVVVDIRSEWTYTNNGGLNQGAVRVSNDCNSVTLQFVELDGEPLTEVEFEIGTVLPTLNNGGNLVNGSLSYSFSDLDENLSITFTFADLGITHEDDLKVFAKAWGKWSGLIPHGKLSYFTYDVAEVECDFIKICETAYLKGDIVLKDYYNQKNDGGNNWGWAADVNLNEGETANFEIWAAAGQNDTSKGVHAGDATVNYDGTVKVELFEGYESTEVHVFVADKLPATRPVPGKFKDYSEEVADGQFILILHMEVCWEE